MGWCLWDHGELLLFRFGVLYGKLLSPSYRQTCVLLFLHTRLIHRLSLLSFSPLPPYRWFWPAYGIYMACAVAMGYMSFKRPACDIFIAGITQFPTTFYCLGALGLRKWPSSSSSSGTKVTTSATTTIDHVSTSPIGHVRLPYRIMYYVGFIGNAPLLPMYPLLVQYSGMSLAGINTLLHSWLMIMWGMQGVSLLHLLNAIDLHRLKVSRD